MTGTVATLDLPGRETVRVVNLIATLILTLMSAATVTAPAARESHSRPGAPVVLYVSFRPVTVGGGWAITTDDAGFSWADQNRIVSDVAGLFARWAIDVVHTTDPRTEVPDGSLVVHVARTGQLCGCGGLGNVNGLRSGVETERHGFVWASTAALDPATVAVMVTHEAGHILGLDHDEGGGLMTAGQLTVPGTWDRAETDLLDSLYPIT